ncbi:RNA ligase RtcB family protein [Burkholderia multivorans]|uniref:RNA ligase RtcB family protein n=1 Tax=Burkholderia ubonensis TaxID=101571 RepID=UPI000F6D82F2|nr:RNA ligase RtcB family protein [Burkholderia ubonensis]AYZ65244.1 RNA ligase RtcB family protein [Burkholderia multivorans]VWB21699.1 RNA ligase [Burkholderia ubonensis]
MGNTLQYLAERVTLCASADTWIEGEAIRQLQLAATLPGMRRVAGMPDLHPGRGYPVGAAFFSTGCLYPALIGGDIGCGMALWQTALDARRASAVRLVGRLGSIDARLDDSWQASIADAGLAGHAFAASLGTIGSGNHFAELQKLDTVYDAEAVQALGLDRGRLQLLVHSGSRGFGQSILERHMAAHGYNALDDTLAECADYLQRHDEALRYAIANRDLIARRMLARWRSSGRCVLDVNHNLVSRAVVDGVPGWLHRKGATPADAGPVVIPGSRGDYSYLVEPLPRDDAATLASLAHGAGRKWSRADCKGRLERRFAPWQLIRTRLGSQVVCENRELLYEEAPQAYKPIDSVVDALEAAGLLRKLARLTPVLTYKTSGECC